MNGIHDLGGMHGMGPIEYEENEPVFHERWEGRLYALIRAVRAWRKSNADADRHAIEQLPPPEYLRPYYERRLAGFVAILRRDGFVTRDELDSGKAAQGGTKMSAPLTAAMAPGYVNRGIPSASDPKVVARFRVGQNVRTRNIHPVGHTRLPRYARGKRGTITRDHGVYNFPDTNAQGLGAKRQHLYSVRFLSAELWGEGASARSFVHLDMWDDYLTDA